MIFIFLNDDEEVNFIVLYFDTDVYDFCLFGVVRFRCTHSLVSYNMNEFVSQCMSMDDEVYYNIIVVLYFVVKRTLFCTKDVYKIDDIIVELFSLYYTLKPTIEG